MADVNERGEQPEDGGQVQPGEQPAGEVDRDAAGETDQLRAEAARHRRAARAAEAERDQLAARLTGFERAEVERAAVGKLHRPADLWAAGVELDELRGDDGQLDPDKISEAVAGVLAERPHWGLPSFAPNPGQAAGTARPPGSASWSTVLRTRG